MKHIITIWNIPWALNVKRILIFKVYMNIGFHSSCGTDLGRSIAMITVNIHEIGVVKLVKGYPTFPITAQAV